MTGPAAEQLPGTAVAPRRRTVGEVIAATSQPVPPVPEQGDLVDHWREAGALDDDQVETLGGEPS